MMSRDGTCSMGDAASPAAALGVLGPLLVMLAVKNGRDRRWVSRHAVSPCAALRQGSCCPSCSPSTAGPSRIGMGCAVWATLVGGRMSGDLRRYRVLDNAIAAAWRVSGPGRSGLAPRAVSCAGSTAGSIRSSSCKVGSSFRWWCRNRWRRGTARTALR
jgi:hypothetical protein